ncbi:MAG: hypothetical protein DRN20_05180, partial [Thermoplasmata archaeon]
MVIVGMNIDKIIRDITEWFKVKKNAYGIVGFAAIIAIFALDLSYWAAHIQAEPYGAIVQPPPPTSPSAGENYTIVAKEVLNEEGTTSLPDGGTGYMAIEYEFEIGENATMAIINLTYLGGGGARPDMDLYIYAPNGKQVGSSATPEASESVTLDEKALRRGGVGTYKA